VRSRAKVTIESLQEVVYDKSIGTKMNDLDLRLHVQWLKLLYLLILHPSSDLCTGSRLMNALNINSCHSTTKFLQPAKLTTYTISSLCSVYM